VDAGLESGCRLPWSWTGRVPFRSLIGSGGRTIALLAKETVEPSTFKEGTISIRRVAL